MRSALRTQNTGLGVLLAIAFAGSANATTVVTTTYITSGFNSGGADGWTATGATATYSTATPPGNSPFPTFDPGINPGFLNVQDSQNKAMFITAPATATVNGTTVTAFSGDLSRFYGYSIYFDAYIIKISGGSSATLLPNWGVISMTGNGVTASYDVGSIPVSPTAYSRVYAPLVSTDWYSGSTGSGTHLVDGQLQAIMANVSAISIDVSLHNSSSDDMAFDDFTISMPEPGTYPLIAAGLASLIFLRSRAASRS